MSKNGPSVSTSVRALAEPFAADLGLTIWDVRYVREGGAYYLRIFIDREGGVTIEDCENLSRAVDGPLDEADLIPDSYYLEVSSPGLNRELTRPEHFEKMKGRPVLVRLYRPDETGCRDYAGILLGRSDSGILLDCDGQQRSFDKSAVAGVRLDDDFEIE